VSPRADDLTTVRLRSNLTVRGGARFNSGETISLDSAMAQVLVDTGIAELSPQRTAEKEPTMPASKAPDRPPNDKMVHQAPWRKGGRA